MWLTDPRYVRTLAALAVAAITSNPADASTGDAHGHYAHVQEAPSPMHDGARWATDAPLRQGMTRIRELIEPWATPAGRPDGKGPGVAAAAIRTQVQFMIDNCKLEPQADAALHQLIADILRGADALSRPASRSEGVALIAAALRRYPQSFDHPGWQSLSVPASHE